MNRARFISESFKLQYIFLGPHTYEEDNRSPNLLLGPLPTRFHHNRRQAFRHLAGVCPHDSALRDSDIHTFLSLGKAPLEPEQSRTVIR